MQVPLHKINQINQLSFSSKPANNSVVVVKKSNSNTDSFKRVEQNPFHVQQIETMEKNKKCEKNMVETTIMNSLQDHAANNKISVTSL